MTASITSRPVDPARDTAVIAGWVTKERARFWGMTECTVEQVGEIYTWMVAQEHLEAHLLAVDGEPVGLFQTYDPFVDEIGEFYDRRDGDLGIHLLLDDHPRRAGRTSELVRHIFDTALSRPGVTRLVFEPDARNDASVALLQRFGAEPGPQLQLTTSIFDKPAWFHFLPRTTWLAHAAG